MCLSTAISTAPQLNVPLPQLQVLACSLPSHSVRSWLSDRHIVALAAIVLGSWLDKRHHFAAPVGVGLPIKAQHRATSCQAAPSKLPELYLCRLLTLVFHVCSLYSRPLLWPARTPSISLLGRLRIQTSFVHDAHAGCSCGGPGC